MSVSSFQPTVKVKLATFCLKSTLAQIMETLWLGLAEIGTERLKVLDTVGCHGRHVLTVLHWGLGQYHWSGRLGWWFPFLKIGTRIIGVLHYSASLGRSSRDSWNWCFGLFTNPWSSYWSVRLSWHSVSRRSQVHEYNRIGNLRIPSLLFADAIDLLASLVNDVWVTLGRFAPEYEAAGMQISTISSQEVVLCQKLVDCSILMGGELLPQTRGIKSILWSSSQETGRWGGGSVCSNAGTVSDCCEGGWLARRSSQLTLRPCYDTRHSDVMTKRRWSRTQGGEIKFTRWVAGFSRRDRMRTSDI